MILMILWKWKAIDEAGNVRQGIWEDSLAASVVAYLRRQQLYPVKIRRLLLGRIRSKFELLGAKIYWVRNARKIGTLLEAGVPILTILDLIAEKESNTHRKARWQRVSLRIQAGNDLSAGLEDFLPRPGVFLEAMIKTGEKSGTLSGCLLEAATQLEEEYYFEQRQKTILFYPLLLLIVALAVLYTLSIVILPMYENLFQGLDAELPLITELLFKIGAYIPFLTGIVILLLILESLRTKRRNFRVIPGSGQIRRYKALMQFCAILGKFFQAGLPLQESLLLLRKIIKEPELVLIISQLELAVTEGKRLSPVLIENSYFPSEAAKMVEIAEESGRLSEMFNYLANMFRQELEEKLQQYTRLLEPVLVVGMATVVGIVAMGVLLPIFDISTYIR